MAQIKEKRISPEWIAAGLMLWLAFTLGMLILAPGREEQSAMRGRDLSTQAQLAAEQGDNAGAVALLEQAVQDPRVDPAVTARLLAAYRAAGRSKDHAAIVTGPLGHGLGLAQLRSAAGYYAQEKMPAARLVALERIVVLKGADAGDIASLAEARLAAGNKEGASEAVKIAMHSLAAGENPIAAVAIARVLNGTGKRPAVAKFARDWLGKGASLAKVLEVAPTFTENGGAIAVQDALRARRVESKEAAAAYDFALAAKAKESPSARAVATHEMLADLAKIPSGAQREALLKTIFSVGDMSLVARDFAQTGLWRAEPVRSVFIYNMKRAGLESTLRTMLVAELKSGKASAEVRRDTARELAQLGNAGDAISLLKSAAAKAGPGSAEFKDLAYLWRSKGLPVDVRWMQSLAAGSNGNASLEWIAAIESLTSPSDAVVVIDRLLPASSAASRPQLLVAKARYLGWKGDSPKLRQVLGDVAQAQLAPHDRIEMAKLSCAVGDARSIEKLLNQKLAEGADEGLRACYARGRLQEARLALKRGDKAGAAAIYASVAAKKSALSAQDYFDYGTAVAALGRKAEAGELFQTGLDNLGNGRRNGGEAPGAMLLRASLLSKLDRVDEAQKVLTQFVDLYPENRRAQVMLADLRLARGDYRGALEVADHTAANP